MSVYLRQYGAAATVRFTLRQADSNAFATNSHWTPAVGDVKLSAGGGALADVTNLPTYANGQWSLSLTAGEMAANPLAVLIDDAAIIPESFIVETFGDASATYPTSYGDQWLGIASKITADHGAGSYVDSGTLTPEQATWLEETHAKAMLIGTGGAVATAINPVGVGGKITLYSGFDYTASTIPIALPGATIPDDEAVTLNAVPDRYGDDGESLVLDGTVIDGEYVFEATRLEIPIGVVGQYRYQVWTDAGGEHEPLVVGTLVVMRGK